MFTLWIEYTDVDGEVSMDKYQGVTSFNDPPMTNNLHLTFGDDREDEKLGDGNIIRGKQENE